MPQKIGFHVVHATSQDDLYKIQQLNTQKPTSIGWRSARYCVYPQTVIIQLNEPVRIRKIQILSHQYIVASKIELFTGNVEVKYDQVSYESAHFVRLGYVTMTDTHDAQISGRELKSINVDTIGMFIKFVLHKNYLNEKNVYNQNIETLLEFNTLSNIDISGCHEIKEKQLYVCLEHVGKQLHSFLFSKCFQLRENFYQNFSEYIPNIRYFPMNVLSNSR
ncbi:hypothetical protein A3Q56_04880 [Intoshia linei]|uniref:Centrosomal protein CEP104 N-terminal domain-containing protein n=1 Tax=Intoshia linei TaxID=1819745 RepID=A0A177AZ48_9BILA|nr:hypothetical protein A3Q56_04880 [Intoshia linei]